MKDLISVLFAAFCIGLVMLNVETTSIHTLQQWIDLFCNCIFAQHLYF